MAFLFSSLSHLSCLAYVTLREAVLFGAGIFLLFSPSLLSECEAFLCAFFFFKLSFNLQNAGTVSPLTFLAAFSLMLPSQVTTIRTTLWMEMLSQEFLSECFLSIPVSHQRILTFLGTMGQICLFSFFFCYLPLDYSFSKSFSGLDPRVLQDQTTFALTQ